MLWPPQMPEVSPESDPDQRLILRQFCRVCNEEIMMQIFMGTGVCCELCRKVDVGEMSTAEWITLKEVNVDARIHKDVQC